MDVFSMIVMIVMITGITNAVKEVAKAKARGGSPEVVDEIRLLREEIRQLRQQHNDVILSFDTTLKQVDRRLDHLEGRSYAGAGQEPETVSARIR